MTLRDLEERLAEFRARGAEDTTGVFVRLENDPTWYPLVNKDWGYEPYLGVILDV